MKIKYKKPDYKTIIFNDLSAGQVYKCVQDTDVRYMKIFNNGAKGGGNSVDLDTGVVYCTMLTQEVILVDGGFVEE